MKSTAALLKRKALVERQNFSLRLPAPHMNALTKFRDRVNAQRGMARKVSTNDIVQLSIESYLRTEGIKIGA